MTNPPEQRHEPRPVLLTKRDALEYAAAQLERAATDTKLAGMILDAMKKVPDEKLGEDGKSRELLAKLRQECVEPELQAKAMSEGAKAIRDMLLEERLVEARAQAHGIREGAER